MAHPPYDSVHLRRVDAAKNMRRFYALNTQPTLFDEISVVRRWGRIGRSGQVKIETFDDESDAARAFVKLVKTKQRRGYEVMR